MSPHALVDMHRSGGGPEPPQLVDFDHTGVTTPTSDGTVSSEPISMASEPIAIVGMGEAQVQIQRFRPLLT